MRQQPGERGERREERGERDGLRSHVYTAGCHGADAEMGEMVMLRVASGHILIISALKVSTWAGWMQDMS